MSPVILYAIAVVCTAALLAFLAGAAYLVITYGER
jgi:hypothetical protein